MFSIKTNEQRSHYYLEVAENCRKKAEMYDKLIASGKASEEKLKDFKIKSRYWWSSHEDYLRKMGDILKVPFPEGKEVKDIVDEAKEIFKEERGSLNQP